MATKAASVRGPKPGRSAAGRTAPKPERRPLGRIPAGAGLSASEKHIWRRTVGRLPENHFAAGDEDLLVDYCRSFVRWEDACRTLAAVGSTMLVGKVRKATPEFDIEDKLHKRLLDLGKRLGVPVSAVDRGRQPVAEAKPASVVRLLPGGKK